MNLRQFHFWRALAALVLLSGLLSPALGPAAAQPAAPNIAVDGVIDAAYGAPLASDPAGDAVNGSNLDLGQLYVAEDAANFYFAFTINHNIATTNWGKYVIYVDTTNNSSGAINDAWGRNVVVNDPHKPEYGLYSWVDCGTYNSSCTQFWQWGGSSWSQNGSIDEVARGVGSTSVLEWRMSKSKLGNPSQIWVEVWSTGGNTPDNPQDTINNPPDDWNASDWTTQGVLANSTQYPAPAAVQLNVTFPPDGYYTGDPALTVTGVVSPALGVVVNVNVNGAAIFTPTLDVSGNFAQPVTLQHGNNTLTVVANDGLNTAQVIRNVQVGADHDNDVFWSQLGHNSRDTLYRLPGGAVTTGTAVTLRLRAASGDLTQAKIRLWNDRTNVQTIIPMAIAADDGTYEWWQATLPVSDVPTVYWYRFIAIDGSDEDYYEDDAASNGQRQGGWGKAYDDSQDYSWQITVYDPAFQTPDWIKNAVVYQIYPDRFRDGDAGNNTPAGSFFYNEPGGTIVRSNQTEWNTVVCDPRAPSTPCTGSYSKNFYGGDLQGLIEKLPYLHDLGITAIYLNPIFESPSNHKYDATDYTQIDDNFGDLATFITLTQQAELLGMHIILDGVFNHVSSDSVYFDRYSRWDADGNPTAPGTNDGSGACESPNSPYRDWFYFTDVYTGTGKCTSSNGTPFSANYADWAGYDSLPKLKASNPEVRAHIWSNGLNSVGPYWMQWADGWRLDVAGDVDPGVTGDPANDYWEGFRAALHAVNPDAYIVGEEWGNASSWTLGPEWDATMNYPFGSAILSFWRDTTFNDNDHNAGSSAGLLVPISPSELDERLRNLQERYAPEAFYAMMNLLGSHDTNRALFLLDENASQNNTSLYWDPNYDWSDAIVKLKGVALLQMTLPGAPTIYYGDEVGLVGPPVYVDYGGGNAKWEDDPYNRQPFPWLDAGLGTPYYAHLQSQASQDALKDYYATLIGIRNAHPALRTGSFDTLLTDDANNIYAYGRMMPDRSDIVVVIVNRDPAPQTVTLDVSGYLAYGDQLQNALDGNAPYTVSPTGQIVIDVPGMYGAILTLVPDHVAPPHAVSDLSVIGERDGEVDLQWSAATGATRYDIYRSLLFGGGYQWVGATTATHFTDSGLTNGVTYYYVVVSHNNTTGLNSGYSNEVSAIPHHIITHARLISPREIVHTIGLTPTVSIYASAFITGVTSIPGATEGLLAQVGYGDSAISPTLWTNWVAANYVADVNGADQFAGQFVPEEIGDFDYLYRFSTTGGRDWVYAGLGPITQTLTSKLYLPLILKNSAAAISASRLETAEQPTVWDSAYGITDVITPGILHVLPSADITPPPTPLNLRVTDWSAGYIELMWDPVVGDPSLYAYDLYRSTISGTLGSVVARILAPTTIYTDNMVTTGETYYYHLRALDSSFNRSGYSNPVSAVPQPKVVAVTFTVRVPAYTPASDTVYIVGDLPQLAAWNPGSLPMTEISPNLWSRTIYLPDGVAAQYKYTRGNWDTVEAWGTITGYANRHVTIDYGVTGAQLVDDTATDWGVGPDDHKAVRDWRDPLVVSVYPAAGATGVPVTDTIRVTWSHTMTVAATFTVSGPGGSVAGMFTYDPATYTVIFTPAAPLDHATLYTVLVSGHGLIQPVTWQFTTAPTARRGYRLAMPR